MCCILLSGLNLVLYLNVYKVKYKATLEQCYLFCLFVSVAVASRNKKAKVFVTEGSDVALTGVCVFFTRASTSKAITAENIHRVRLKPPNTFIHLLNPSEASVYFGYLLNYLLQVPFLNISLLNFISFEHLIILVSSQSIYYIYILIVTFYFVMLCFLKKNILDILCTVNDLQNKNK